VAHSYFCSQQTQVPPAIKRKDHTSTSPFAFKSSSTSLLMIIVNRPTNDPSDEAATTA